MDVRHSVADPTFDARVNIMGFINLLEGCKNAGVKKVIFASSGGAVYGEQESIPGRRKPCDPTGESLRREQAHRRALSVLLSSSLWATLYRPALRQCLRSAPVGPRRGRCGGDLLVDAIAGKTPIINGDGKQTPRLCLRWRCGRGQCRGARSRPLSARSISAPASKPMW